MNFALVLFQTLSILLETDSFIENMYFLVLKSQYWIFTFQLLQKIRRYFDGQCVGGG